MATGLFAGLLGRWCGDGVSERGWVGWKQNVFGYKCSPCRMKTRGVTPAEALHMLWPPICAGPEVTGKLWELLGEVPVLGRRRPDLQALMVPSGLEIKQSVIAGIKVLLHDVLT